MRKALTVNEFGVVVGGHETISMELDSSGWAAIKLAELEEGVWIWATSWQTGLCGCSEPLMPMRSDRVFSRSEAVELGATAILADVDSRSDREHAELRSIRAWCEALRVGQLDMFEVA